MRRGGYILFETVVAMAVLSLSMVAIHSAIRQAVLTRGQAQDYTTARFLLEKVTAEKELQPELAEGKEEGDFEGELSRFSYKWEISKVEVPMPPIPPDIPEEQRKSLEKMFKGYMGKLSVRISWTRAGQPFEVLGETLFKPEKLWLPPKPDA